MKLALFSFMALSVATFAPAQAGMIYTGSSAEMPTDNTFSLNFNSGAPSSSLSFNLNGYNTLDGNNFYEDDFSLNLNGTQIFLGTFNLGGGASSGQAVIYLNTYNAILSNPTNNGLGISGTGGTELISFANVPLNGGSNTLVFAYNSLPRPDHAGFQGTGDEGWGVGNVTVGVPEPSTWAMMLLGFAGLGFASYRASRESDAALAV